MSAMVLQRAVRGFLPPAVLTEKGEDGVAAEPQPAIRRALL
jgi:hypothetical protein